MAYHRKTDPGKVNAWKSNVAKGVQRAHRQCPSCSRKSTGGTFRFLAERVTVWRCRYCGHEIGKSR